MLQPQASIRRLVPSEAAAATELHCPWSDSHTSSKAVLLLRSLPCSDAKSWARPAAPNRWHLLGSSVPEPRRRQIRNSKSQIRNKCKIPGPKAENLTARIFGFGFG